MKTHRLFLFTALLLSLLSGCTGMQTPESMDYSIESVPATPVSGQMAYASPAPHQITEEQAMEIALRHSGYTAEQALYLCTKFEYDNGVPQYEVQFHVGRWEYEYDIHAETGEILSYSRDI